MAWPDSGICFRGTQLFLQDGYKIIAFDPDADELDGLVLDPVCRNAADPRGVADSLLRWHFRNAVLANMKGAREPQWDYDFSHGSDLIGQIMAGPDAARRMEAELGTRLWQVQQS